MQPPSPFVVARIYAEARTAVLKQSNTFDSARRDQSTVHRVSDAQSFLRRVHDEFHRQLAAAGIAVEGA